MEDKSITKVFYDAEASEQTAQFLNCTKIQSAVDIQSLYAKHKRLLGEVQVLSFPDRPITDDVLKVAALNTVLEHCGCPINEYKERAEFVLAKKPRWWAERPLNRP